MFTNMLRKRMSPQVHWAQAAFRSKILHDNLFVLTRILRAGKANKTVSVPGRALALRSGGMGYPPSC
jgi:hypothetical protein